MVLSPYRFNKRHAARQREHLRERENVAQLESEAAYWRGRIEVRFGNAFTMRQENIEQAAKKLADYLTDCAAGKQAHCPEVENQLRHILRGHETGQWWLHAE